MVDAPSDAGTPPEDAPAGLDGAGDGQEEEEEEEEANEGGDEDEGSSMPATSPAPSTRGGRGGRGSRGGRGVGQSPTPVKRRPGRPPKYPRPPVEGSDREGSDATPRRGRGGWRGGRGFGGGRWKNKNLQRQQAQPVDKDGQPLEIENDEAKMDEDPAGEQKVDKDGYLQGGREYRVRTFTIEGKGRRLYMLSTEPARCIGFRDSYLFFQKHRMLYKIILTDEDKLDLIDRDLMPHSYKGRTIGVVTARSVFREFGAAIIISGRKIIDDYREADMRAEGAVEGEVAVPDDVLPGPGEEYDRNRYVAWHGASQVYHTSAPALPVPGTKAEVKKRKITVTGSNWMLEHAREAG
jgi:chromatin structure-remodeling complex protein RSC7